MTRPLLEARSVTKAFGHFLALRNISLELRENQVTALIGPNGAGKTTFYNLVSGRMRPTQGELRFCGEDIVALPPHRINRLGIARSFQITNIFNELTVLENAQVALVAHQRLGLKVWRAVRRDQKLRGDALALLDRFGLTGLADLRAGALSYGDKRLVELAIVLASEPRLILLDEPTAGMTPEETEAVVTLIRKLAGEGHYTFFITEHDMDVVFGLAERIIVFHHGELLADGSPQVVRSDPAVRTAYLGEEG